MSEPASNNDPYDFAEETPAIKPKAAMQAGPRVAAASPRILSYRATNADKPLPAETEQIKHVYLPLGLLAGGIFVELLSAIVWSHHIGPALVELSIDLTLGTGMMLVAMMMAAKIRGIDLGKLGVATYKLAAISIAPAAIAEFLDPILRFIPVIGGIGVFVIEFILFFALLGALFDLDESDTWYCVCIMFITRVSLYFVLQTIFHP